MKYKYKMLATVLVLSAQAILFTKTADAAIFKCVNEQGATFYNDKPCPKENVETKMKAVKAPKDPYIPQDIKTVNINNDVNANGVFVGVSSKEGELNKKPKGSKLSHYVGEQEKATISKPESGTNIDVSNSKNKNSNSSQPSLKSTEPPGIIE
ncbi:DUF4124 domain-containing protein [uncultured Cocleimonas sp.]|uniref:DUF4124 domain-containing protein n=1 Tax=uncultured Cocleimonas sp. TaxID=1051587 RepID=UPI00261B8AFB|nr:DUF4124 domain-containing protein [uncultured Cocleimonas sp.]